MNARLLSAIILLVALPLAAVDHKNQQKGFKAENVYSVSDIDSVNAFNGNLTVSIPIGPSYPISETFSYGLRLSWNANLWEGEVVGSDWSGADYGGLRNRQPASDAEGLCNETTMADGIQLAHPHRRTNAGLGWTMTLGRLFDPNNESTGGRWLYESSDGAEHEFGYSGSTTRFSKDGTYLRLSPDGAAGQKIEFPDGTIHHFVLIGSGERSIWMPVRIENRFTANYVQIDYNTATPTVANGMDWVITDNHLRTQKVVFQPLAWDDGPRLFVKSVDLMAFGTQLDGSVTTQQALYQFNYTSRQIGRPSWAERCSNSAANARVQTLDSIELPDDPTTATEGLTKYAFGYKTSTNWADDTGTLQELTQPTGGKIKWTWGWYFKPNESAANTAPFLAGSVGVVTRQMLLPNGTVASSRTFLSELDDNYLDDVPSDTDWYPRQMTNTITDEAGNRTVSYFSVSSTWAAAPAPWSSDDYGRPFTKYFSVPSATGKGPLWLSSVTYPPSATISPKDITVNPLTNALRATYVRYEQDDFETNPRVASSRTVHYGANGAVLDFTEVDYTDHDGAGHYRTTTTVGSGSPIAKRVTTNFNSTRPAYAWPDYIAWPITNPWQLSTYDYVETVQGTLDPSGNMQATSTARTDFCFDATTGFLNRKRIRRGMMVDGVARPEYDLLTLFTDNNQDGSVDIEWQAGGDATPLGAGFTTCTGSVTPTYQINHAYSYGVRSTTEHVGTSFKSLNLTIDPTGVPSSSVDVSGLFTTRFRYNPAGQLREVHPQGEAWTEYTYTVNPAAMPFGTVTARQYPETTASGGSALTEARYYYDAFGRLVQQRTWLGSAGTQPWSASGTSYDAAGRKSTASVAVGTSSGNWSELSAAQTLWAYDPLSRPKSITEPDGSVTSMLYTGSRQVERTSKIAAPTPTNVTTVERHDAHGRLIEVVEDSTSSALSTTYTYDEGDRLESVTSGIQSRTFLYDGAGLLSEEDHPESAAVKYQYDAAGQTWRQTRTGGEALRFAYDAAGRPTKVWEDLDGAGAMPEQLAKEFVYDTGIGKLGKVDYSIRHNRQPSLGGTQDVTVKETYTYGGRGGRVSSKQTQVGMPDGSEVSFKDNYAYTILGAVDSVTYPCWSATGTCEPAGSRTVVSSYTAGLLTAVAPYTLAPTQAITPITYHPNGVLQSIRHQNANQTSGPVYTQQIAATNMPRPHSISVTDFCNNFSVTAPADKIVTSSGQPANITAQAFGASSFQWYYGESGDTTAPIANQISATLTVTVSTASRFWVRASNGACTVDSTSTNVSVAGQCAPPSAAIATGTSMTATTTATASVPPASGATYAWSVTNGTIESGQGTAAITYRASCSGPVTIGVAVSTSCTSTPVTASAQVAVTAPTAVVSGTQSTTGTAATIFASLTGRGPWVLHWNDGTTQNVTDTLPFIRTIERSVPASAYTYNVTSATSFGCAAAVSGQAAITAAPSGCTPPAAAVSLTVAAAWAGDSGLTAATTDAGAGASYVWSVENGTITSGQGTRNNMKFSVGCAGEARISVVVTVAGCSRTASATLMVYASTVTLEASNDAIFAGESTTLTLSFIDQGVRTVHWSDGTIQQNVTGPTLSRVVTPAQTTIYGAVVQDALSCRSESGTVSVVVQQCADPDIAIDTGTTIGAGGELTASVPFENYATYVWSITNGTILSGAGTRSITYRAGCSGNVELSVAKTVTCPRTAARSVPIVAPSGVFSPGGTIAQGGSFQLQLALTGTGPWTITWSDGVVQSVPAGVSMASRSVTPPATTTYTAQLRNAANCNAAITGSATVTVIPPTPLAIVATAQSPTSVTISWSFTGAADLFVIKRNGGGGWGVVGTAAADERTFTDAAAEPNRAYLYAVFASKQSTLSNPGLHDLATTVAFTDDPVTVNHEPATEHIMQLRVAVSAVRTLANGGPLTLSDPILTSGMEVRAVHITELRDALNAARTALVLSPVAYSLPMAAFDAPIRAAHINELRGGVK